MNVYVEVHALLPNKTPVTKKVKLGLDPVDRPQGLDLRPLYDAGDMPGASTRRFSVCREAAWGFDGWARRKTYEVLADHTWILFNDVSLEHGGFPGHASHGTGVAFDARYPGAGGSGNALNTNQGTRRTTLTQARDGDVARQQQIVDWILQVREQVNKLLPDPRVRRVLIGRGFNAESQATRHWNWNAIVNGRYEPVNGVASEIINPATNSAIGSWTHTKLTPANDHLDHIHVDINK